MVTLKRQIKTEEDRYGGFSEIDVNPQASNVGNSFLEAQKKEAESNVTFTMPPTMSFQQDIVQNNVREEEYAPTPTMDQVMFKVQTNKSEPKQEPVVKEKMDSRTKAILGVYLTIILILSALVIATGVFLSSADARVDALENEIAVKNSILTSQLEEISYLVDEDVLLDKAIKSGMEMIDSAESIDLLPMGDAPTYEGTTNWFDSFCDWISRVFGG